MPSTFFEIPHLPQNEVMLRLYDRALAATSCGIVISDVKQPNNPIVYCNPAFERITGYSRDEVLGRNCRFLQGPDTDTAAVEQIRTSLREGRECQVILKNYRKDGTLFWNELKISPVFDGDGQLTHYIGVQTDITERVFAEEQAQLMLFSLDSAGDAAFWMTSDARLFYVNEAACRSLGYSRQELLQLTIYDIDPDFPKAAWLQPWNAIKQQGSFTIETRYRTKKGRIFPVEVTLNYLEFNDQEYYCALVRDITERKRAEAVLRQQAERERLVGAIATRIRQSLDLEEVLKTTVMEVRQVLKTDRVLFYRLQPDNQGVIVESTGENIVSIIGTPLQDSCFVDDYVPQYQQGWIQTIESIHKAGFKQCQVDLLTQFQVTASVVVPVVQGEKLWGLLIVHHCRGTRQWQVAEIQLLRQLGIQLAIALQQAELYQKLSQELAERSAAEAALRQSEALLREQASELAKTLQELQQTQAQLIQSEKMSSLGHLVAGVAHEINNPVTFITGNLVYARDYTKELLDLLELYHCYYPQPVPEIAAKAKAIDLNFLMADFPRLLNSMQVGADRIHQIVLSLRNFCRLDEAEYKLVNLHEGLDNTLLILQHRLRPQGHKPGITILKEYGKLPLVECYPGQLNQVFMNLLSNAIDALEEGVESMNGQQTKPIIRIQTAVLDNQRLVVRIGDNGPGIPKAIQQHIFDPFFTTKPIGRGTGLGLSISYQIVVEKHHGQLQYHSTPQQGTEFIVEIPLKQLNQLLPKLAIAKSN